MPSGTAVNEEIPQEKQEPDPSRQCNNLAESSNDDSSDEEDDDTPCKICKIPSIEITDKGKDWIQCDIWDEYICPKCYDKKNISADDDFFVVFPSDHKNWGEIFIQLSTRALNYAMKLSTLIKSLLISMHWVKIFKFFPCVTKLN